MNALAAIPGPEEQHLNAGAIFNRQEHPRLSLQKLRWMLARARQDNLVERITVGTKWHYYRHVKPEKKTTASQLAAATKLAYTHALGMDIPRVNEVSTEQTDPFYNTLYPLKSGQSVHLWLDTPNKLKNRSGASRKLIVLCPGSLVRINAACVVVSVIGSGSSLLAVDPLLDEENKARNIASLVLAGVPAKLATPLMETLHRVFKET